MHRKNNSGLGLAGLVGLSAGSSIASGVFVFSGDFAAAGAGTAAVLIGWLIAGVGMLAVVMCFYGLGNASLMGESGIYGYTKNGIGRTAAFYIVWSYWLSILFGNLSFLSLLADSASYFLDTQSSGTVLAAQSIFIWFTAVILLKGTEYAAGINFAVAIFKILPLFAFVFAVICFKAFNINIFLENFWGQDTGYNMAYQIKATTGISLWAFVGIEGAVAVSARARHKNDVGKALVISFMCVFLIYVLISVLSMGVMTRQQLASLGNPPLAYIFEKAAGKTGAVIVNAGVLLALGGAYLGYNLLAAECMAEATQQGAFTEVLKRRNKNGSPMVAVIVTCCLLQLLEIVFTLMEADYQNIYELAARLCAPVYFVMTICYLRICIKKEQKSIMEYMAAAIGTVYGLYMICCMGIEEIITLGVFAVPGTILYIIGTKKSATFKIADKL